MPRPRHKFQAKATECDGIKFPSKLEARHYQRLKQMREEGKLAFFLRQVPLHLAGGTKLVVDWVLFTTDGEVRFVDSKGMETDAFKIKKREVEAHYPITIEIWKD